MTDPIEQIARKSVEDFLGGTDMPGFEACVSDEAGDIARLLKTAEACGYVFVPTKVTQEMYDAGFNIVGYGPDNVYKAMIEAGRVK